MIEYILMAVMGLAVHVLKKMIEMSRDGEPVSIVDYWTKFHLQTVLSVIGTAVGVIALNHYGELSVVSAFGVGYMGNSVADVVGKRSMKKLG